LKSKQFLQDSKSYKNEIPLGELVENFDSKRIPISKTIRKKGIIPYYGASGIIDHVDDFVLDGEYLLISEDGENLRSRKTSIAFLTKGKFWPNNHVHVVRANKKSNNYFLFHVLNYIEINGFLTGTAQPKLNQENLNLIPIPNFSSFGQQKIGNILHSITKTIENHKSQNESLEKIAQSFFKSWFIDFDGQTEFVDSELGEIPKGWKILQIRDVIKIFDNQRIPLSKGERKKKKGKYPYYGATSIIDFVDDYIFDGKFLLLGEDGSVIKDDGTPFVQIVDGKIWVNNHAHVIQGKDLITTEFLFLFFKRFNIDPWITGAVQLKINQENLMSIPIMVPLEKTLLKFNEIIKPIFSKISRNTKTIDLLTKTHASLLPKLMSGDLIN
jgi:type I restriction enzyme, S subunit